MKRTVINVTTSLLAFVCGLSVASDWNSNGTVKNGEPKIIDCSSTLAPAAIVEHDAEVVFGGGRLRIVTEEIKLKSERLRYDIEVRYPQIVGTEDRHIRRLNQRIKQLASKHYNWQLNGSKKELQLYKDTHAEAFNSVDIDYQVLIATDFLLSIYFIGYEYSIGAAHSTQYSFVINYDLVAGKELRLGHLFKPRSNYLERISRYCNYRLSLDTTQALDFTRDPESWNITPNGLRINFDHCTIFPCAEGSHEVEIPFASLNEILKTELKL